jgi:hypothetical protein
MRLLFFSIALFISACSSGLDRFGPAVSSGQLVAVYRGLPHPVMDKELFEKERAKGKTRELHGFLFYEPPNNLNAESAKALTQIFANPQNFQPFQKKLCGPFHPDYAIEWKVGVDIYHAQICFGCEEVKFYGPRISAHQDFQNGVFVKVRDLLVSLKGKGI